MKTYKRLEAHQVSKFRCEIDHSLCTPQNSKLGSSEEMFPVNNKNHYMSRSKTKTLSLSKSPKKVNCKNDEVADNKVKMGICRKFVNCTM